MRHYSDKQDAAKTWHFDFHCITDAGNSAPLRIMAKCRSHSEVQTIGHAISLAYGHAPWDASSDHERISEKGLQHA